MRAVTLLLIALPVLTLNAQAAFHVMQIEEIIGSLNGNSSAQAIQLRLRSSGQNLVANARLWAWDASGSNRVLLLDIASNVSNSALGAHVLLTTSSFTSTMIAGGATTFVPDFTLSNNIPFSYLNAGRLTFEDDIGTVATAGTIYWSVSWGGAGYTGSVTGNTQNDADGNFGPAFGLGLRSGGTSSLRVSSSRAPPLPSALLTPPITGLRLARRPVRRAGPRRPSSRTTAPSSPSFPSPAVSRCSPPARSASVGLPTLAGVGRGGRRRRRSRNNPRNGSFLYPSPRLAAMIEPCPASRTMPGGMIL